MSRVVRLPAREQRISEHGLLFIAHEEGIRLRPYYDSRHLVTAGVGHLVTPPHSEITAQDERRFAFPSVQAALDFFRRVDMPFYERGVRAALGNARVSRAEYDMCCSLAFNIGVGGFARSMVAHYIRQGDYRRAARAFYGWAIPSELRPRRGRESARFRIAHW